MTARELDINRPNWQDRAACRNHPGDLWFSDKADDKHEAIAICNRCPVRELCLNEALTTASAFGIFGGYTPKQRRGQYMNRTNMPTAKCGTEGGYRRHLRTDEVPCAWCKQAHATAAAERKQRRKDTA